MGLERLKSERNSDDFIERIGKGYVDNSKRCYPHLTLISIFSSRGKIRRNSYPQKYFIKLF